MYIEGDSQHLCCISILKFLSVFLYNVSISSPLQKASARPFNEDFGSDSDRSELSDIAEEEEDLSEFGEASLPGLHSENSEGKRSRTETEEKKRIRDTLKHYATRESEFDTDPEVEQLSKPDKAIPIPIIRQQRDFDRESEQSPHNAVVEPVPMKASNSAVPHIGKDHALFYFFQR